MQQDNILVFKFNEPITERNSFPALAIEEKHTEVHVEFSERTYFNSVGIRDWMKWLSPIKKNHLVKLILFNCPTSIINQINLISDFLPSNAVVSSFFVQFINTEGTETKAILLKKDDVYIGGKVILPVVKDSKGQIMEVDVNHKFFKFLNKI